jgi:hypothetical protein
MEMRHDNQSAVILAGAARVRDASGGTIQLHGAVGDLDRAHWWLSRRQASLFAFLLPDV